MSSPAYSMSFQSSKCQRFLLFSFKILTSVGTKLTHSSCTRRYAKDNLKFGKIDISRSPKIADKYGIVSSVTSRTLPTLILFKNGREHVRRPLLDSRERVVPFSFSYVSVMLFGQMDSPESSRLGLTFTFLKNITK